MRTPPGVTEELIARRQALGQDRRDEVWEGVYHVAPEASNRHLKVQLQLIELLGQRARHTGLLLGGPINVGRPLDFRVPDLELLIVDQVPRTVEWFARGADGFVPADGSAILGITSEELATTSDWPG